MSSPRPNTSNMAVNQGFAQIADHTDGLEAANVAAFVAVDTRIDGVDTRIDNLPYPVVTLADPAAAAAQALVVGSKYGGVALAPLGTGADDDVRYSAVEAVCLGKYELIKVPGVWYDGATPYTVSPVPPISSGKPSLSLARWFAERPAAPQTDPTITLPSWMTFAGSVCNNAGVRAPQVGPDAVAPIAGGGANTAVWISVDGINGGVSLQPPATQQLHNSGPWNGTLDGWAVGGLVRTAVLGPDGVGTNAGSFPITNAAVSDVFVAAPGLIGGIYSGWFKRGAITGAPVAQLYSDQLPNVAVKPIASTTSWARYEAIRTGVGATQDGYANLDAGGSTMACECYGAQYELTGKVATELVLTANNISARTAGSITISGLQTNMPMGTGCITLGWRPWYASTESSTDDKLMPFSANDYLRYNFVANTLELVIGAVSVITTNAITFSRNQRMMIRVTILPGYAAIQIMGATTGDGTYSSRDAIKATPLATPVSNTMTYTAVLGNPWDLYMMAFDYPLDPQYLSTSVLCIGDSITAFAEWQLQAWKTMLTSRGVQPIWVGSQSTYGLRNEGHGGYAMWTLQKLSSKAIQTYLPEWVVLIGGTNDVFAGATGADMLYVMGNWIDTCVLAGIPASRIVVGSIPPFAADPAKDAAGRIPYNAGLPALCASKGCVFCDAFGSMPVALLAGDLIHPSHPAGMNYGGDRLAYAIG